MNSGKKILCSFLVMLLALLSVTSAYAAYYDEGYNGMTEANAYRINTLADLTALRDRVNNGTEPGDRYYKQTQDITAQNWTSIGTEARPFTGHFNGNGNTITITGNNPVFGYVDADDVAVKYLNVKGTLNYAEYYTYGGGNSTDSGIVQVLKSGVVENCNFDGKIFLGKARDHQTVGGIAGVVEANGTIKNCRVSGDITANSARGNEQYDIAYAGGIAGRLEGGTIEKCRVTINDAIYAYNSGLAAQAVGSARAGGIVGYVSGESSKVDNCVVKGIVRSQQYAGGIVGYMQAGTLTNCYVLGDSAVEANYISGSIAGYLGGDAMADTNMIELDSQVSAVSEAVGGIIGHLNSGTVTNNRAYTRVKGRAQYKGAIIGKATGSPNIISDNYYYSDSGASNVIGFDNSILGPNDIGGETHTEETSDVIDPVDPDPLNPSPFKPNTPVVVITIDTDDILPSGEVGTAYSQTLIATPSTVTWAVESGSLPNGLELSTAGEISGTPTLAGSFKFTVRATSSNGVNSVSKEFTLAISPTPTPVSQLKITTETLPDGKVGEEYNAEIETSGALSGTVPTWIITGLPEGMNTSHDGSKAKIGGTPTKAGTFTVEVAVSDTQAEASKTFMLTIAEGESDDNTQEFTWNGHRYRVYADKKKPEEARAFCEAQGGYLCTITSQEEQTAVYNFLKTNGYTESYWLGGTDHGHEGKWIWVNGEEWSYSNWRSGEPNNGLGRGQDYTAILMGSGWDGKWDDDYGGYDGYTLNLGFICEWGGDNHGEDTATLNGHRYRIYPDGMTWSEAKAYCESLGGHLVTISSQEEEDVVEKLVLAGSKNSYWLGGQKDENGNWSWIDGTAWDYTHWDAVEPNYDWEDKLMMYRLSNPVTNSVPGTWNNLQDNGTFEDEPFFGTANIGFVCEWDTTGPVPDLLVITTDSLPNAKVNEPYSFTLTTNFGPAIWTLVSEDGELPDGITLDSSTGEIFGTPTEAGSFDFTVLAGVWLDDGSDSRTVFKDFTLFVEESD
ncbi:MAG: putative Ig domain-containing protein, partial [Synergistaceae bacterium]|nr:putative Ig domain-containing protein [Synergistaceae bacterium]